ncbi:MAG: hypothetical protein UW70_C0100G0007 [Candidatus Peregrinibacteria bacterium GW2011_GWA2_44_7]|nr:MAG: hypothetical protein UW70_C0100G0007 [Candidatus Peregrinibacteria bacterium GW2011_GWA2_44_7]
MDDEKWDFQRYAIELNTFLSTHYRSLGIHHHSAGQSERFKIITPDRDIQVIKEPYHHTTLQNAWTYSVKDNLSTVEVCITIHTNGIYEARMWDHSEEARARNKGYPVGKDISIKQQPLLAERLRTLYAHPNLIFHRRDFKPNQEALAEKGSMLMERINRNATESLYAADFASKENRRRRQSFESYFAAAQGKFSIELASVAQELALEKKPNFFP